MVEVTGTSPGVRFFDVGSDEAGQRIDNFLVARLKGVPKSRIYRLLRKGEVRVNKGRIKPEYRLNPGDRVRVPPIRQADAPPPPVPGAGLRTLLEGSILLETDALLVVDKPAGLAVHGGSGVSLGLIEALRASRPDPFLELVHRLDRGTSGCLLVARKRSMLRHLQQALREGQVTKTYLCLVVGSWPKGLDRIDAPLLKTTVGDGERIVRADVAGKQAVTHFRVVKRFAAATLLEVGLETGRTHQIRVHCQLAGHPLLGDDKYGRDDDNDRARAAGLKRMFLHAHRLRFVDPSGEAITVESPLPDDLAHFLERLP
ncbi:MAG: RluA family pseudouridine synthase [Porticoccaceae bacterium]